MALLKLYLLGPFMATLDGAPLAGLRSGKSRALLAYLAGEPGRPHQRAALATLLWGEHPNDAARLSLRVALSSLRAALAPLDPTQDFPPLLDITHESVQFARDPCRCWVDVVEFDALLDACAAHAHQAITRCPSCIRRLEEAADLYRGDFLADLTPSDSPAFEEWQLLCQERYHHRAITALEQVARRHLALGHYEEAQRYARRQLALEPWRETAHRQLMRGLALGGQRCAALAQYEVCRNALERELGAAPEAETTGLWARIRDGTLMHSCESNLPVQPTPFIGRAAELEQIGGLLGAPGCRLVSLVGPGGMGKTRLALEAAGQQCGAFADGVCFVPAAFIDSAEALAVAIADALQLTPAGNGTPARVEILNCLRRKELLLVLDDIPPLPPVVGWIVDLLRHAPGVSILATARQPLNVRSECLFAVEGLAYPDSRPASDPDAGSRQTEYGAVQLFASSARRALPGFVLTADELPHVTRICQLVDGIPLAIELAAAWTPTLSCAEISQEIQRDLGFLTTSLQDMPERHRSLKAVAAHAWTFLTPDEQNALSRLSALRGRFDRTTASEVAGAGLATLASLAAKALLHRSRCAANGATPIPSNGSRVTAAQASDREDGTYYTLHELVRRHAAARLEQLPGEPAATQDRHCTCFLAFLDRRRPALEGVGQLEALAAIADQNDNIRLAWDWALAHGRAAALGDALYAVFLFCYMRSRFRQGEEMFGRLVTTLQGDAAPGSGIPLGLALTCQGWFTFLLGNRAGAEALLQRGLALLRTLDAPQATAFNLAYGGTLALRRGDCTAARRVCQESLALYRAAGDRYGMAVALNILSRAAHQGAEYDAAQRQCQESLELARSLGNRWSLAFSLEHLGEIALAQQDYRRAGPLFAESLAIRREMGDQRGIGTTLNHLGDISLMLGDRPQAEQSYREALANFDLLGYAVGAEQSRAGLARCAAA